MEKTERFTFEYGLGKKTAQNLTEDKYLAQWYEDALAIYSKTKADKEEKSRILSNWIAGEMFRKLKETSSDIRSIPVEPAGLVELLVLLEKGDITQVTAKQVFARMFDTGKPPSKIIKEEGLSQVSKKEDLHKIIQQIVSTNQQAVEDFRKGKEASFGFIIGQVMRKTQGKANPKVVAELLKKELSHGN